MEGDKNTEASKWLQGNNNPSALASNRFGTTQKALVFVEKLYELGAQKVLIDNIFNEESRIESEGGPYADSIIVELPTDPDKRTKLYELYNAEALNEGFEETEDDGADSLTFWWD
ncbi:MAG: hypothetical protein PHS44_00045 [Candidatus Dojkabacteria bacterium]|nr:hypothetical protein [Candidatus Dojkabacteria bacterium]